MNTEKRSSTNLKTAYLHSALRRLGYSYSKAMAAPAVRACLLARVNASQRQDKGYVQRELGL